MFQLKSTTIQDAATSYELEVEFSGINAKKKSINSIDILNEDIARLRADAEFLEYATDRQEVTFRTYYMHANINDVISISAPDYRIPKDLSKDRFLIKSIKSTFVGAKATMEIKAVRYD